MCNSKEAQGFTGSMGFQTLVIIVQCAVVKKDRGSTQGCSRSIDLGGKDQDHLIELDLLW